MLEFNLRNTHKYKMFNDESIMPYKLINSSWARTINSVPKKYKFKTRKTPHLGLAARNANLIISVEAAEFCNLNYMAHLHFRRLVRALRLAGRI